MMKYTFLAILFLSTTIHLFAQGPPITAETPVMLGLEGNGIRTFGKFISKEHVNIYVQPIGIPYNVTTKFQIGGILPFKVVSPEGGASIKGLADIAVFAKHQLYKKDGVGKTFRILINLKQTFPTAKEALSAIDIYQTYVGFTLGRITSAIGIYGDFGYTRKSGLAPDNFSYNFSMGIPLLPQQYPQKQINAYLGFNGNYLFEPAIHELFITPGLQFIPGRRILFETSFFYPVLQQNIPFNKTNYMFLLGTRFLIN